MRAVEANSGALQRARARICTAIPPPQQIQPKSDRLLGTAIVSACLSRSPTALDFAGEAGYLASARNTLLGPVGGAISCARV